MKHLSYIVLGFSLCFSLVAASGCGTPAPTVIEVPPQTPEEAAAEAEAYEKSMSTDS
jgi:hypothetical protein